MKTIYAAIVLLLACSGLAQTNIVTFTNIHGEVFNRVKVLRVDDTGIVYTLTQGAGGGHVKFSDMPKEISAQFVATPWEATDARIFITNGATRTVFRFSAYTNLNQRVNFGLAVGRKSKEPLSEATDVPLRIMVGVETLTFTAQSPLKNIKEADGRYEEALIYDCSLEDLKKIAAAETITLLLKGSFKTETIETTASDEMKKFVHYWTSRNADAKSKEAGSESADAQIKITTAAKMIDSEYGYTHWSWKAELTAVGRNYSNVGMEFEFLDADGFLLESAFKYPINIKEGQKVTVTDKIGIKVGVASKIRSWRAVIKN